MRLGAAHHALPPQLAMIASEGGSVAAATSLTMPSFDTPAAAAAVTRQIPSSGEQLPLVGLGSWKTFNVGDERPLQDECAAVIAAFLAGGGRLIDSSPMYGSSQPTIGYGLRKQGTLEGLFSADKVWAAEVVPPGESILRVVPVGGDLVAEVRIKPQNIADVNVGDKADIKVSAFDFTRYGKLKGEVASISPTTFETEDHQLFYKAVIHLDRKHSAGFAPYSRLQPGMTVDADVISGSKSLLRYLLKPVFRGVDVAFSDR